MRKIVTMRQALEDDAYFGGLLGGDSWRSWRTMLIACMGEALTDAERAIFKGLTERDSEPLEQCREAWFVIGRRGGKSQATAYLAAYVSACCDYREVLAAGQRLTLPMMALSQSQASELLNYTSGAFSASPALRGMVTKQTADIIQLKSGCDICVMPANYRTLRGITAPMVICDELAIWRSDVSANPDKEVLRALRPSLLTTKGMLVCISSPYAQKGELYTAFTKHFGAAGKPSIVVAKATSLEMNPGLDPAIIEDALADDPEAARADYLAEFRSDLSDFISRELIENAVDQGVLVRPPAPGLRYVHFCDVSSGMGQDAFALTICHKANDGSQKIVVDLCWEKQPPFNANFVIAEICGLMREYNGLRQVTGDRYGIGFAQEEFKRHGVTYKFSTRNRSELYLENLSIFTSGRVRLPDDKKLVAQWCSLERRPGTNHDTVDHPKGRGGAGGSLGGYHDDKSSSCAGAIVEASIGRPTINWKNGLHAFDGLPQRYGGNLDSPYGVALDSRYRGGSLDNPHGAPRSRAPLVSWADHSVNRSGGGS